MSSLLKILGVAFGLAVIVGNTIGTGILRTSGEVAAALPVPALFFAVWVAGGAYAMIGATSLAELATMMPRSGGQYVYARRAFGDFAGFTVGWTDWVSTSAAVAAAAIAIGEVGARMVGPLAGHEVAIATSLTILFTFVQWLGVREGDLSQQLLSALKVLVLLALVVACYVMPHAAASAAGPPRQALAGAALVTALVVALQSVLYTYDGWTGMLYFSGEVPDPARQIPRSMIFGLLVVIAVYLLLNAAFVHVLGVGNLAGEKFAAAASARVVFGDAGERLVAVVTLVTLVSCANACIMLASRVPFAMSEDGLLPAAAQRLNKGGSPDIALFAGALVVLGFIWTGTLTQVLAVASFYYVMQYGVSYTALFVLRRREPDVPRPFRSVGYPVLPALAWLGSLAFLVAGLVGDRGNSLRAIAGVAVAYPIYRLMKRLSAASSGR